MMADAHDTSQDYITATYVVTPKTSLCEAITAIQRYTSVSTEMNIDSMLRQLYKIVTRKKRGSQEFVHRIKSYISISAEPTPLRNSDEFALTLKVPAKAFHLMNDGVPQLLAMFASNVFRSNALASVKWVDLSLPEDQIAQCQSFAPKYGLQGIKNSLGIRGKEARPLLAANIQPAFGLDVGEYAQVSQYVAKEGVEIIVEDELLKELPFCPLRERISEVSGRLERLRLRRLYLVNVLGWSDALLREAATTIKSVNKKNQYVLTGVIIDPFFSGFGLMKYFREEICCPIFCHYYSSGFFARSSEFGIALSVLIKLAVLTGADIVYIGSVLGGHVTEDPAILRYCAGVLRGTRPHGVYPAIAGGISATNLAANLRHFGLDTVLHVGAGIFGHPLGPHDGISVFKKLIKLAQKSCIGKCRI